MIARIDTPRALVGRLIHHLLIDIGIKHPQALVYPLTVASKSASAARKNAATKILKSMCDHSNTLVQQARMVGGTSETNTNACLCPAAHWLIRLARVCFSLAR